jgi:hypothetical protein
MTVWAMRASALAFLILIPFGALAQNPSPPQAAPAQQLLNSEELDALVAPIALYPDPLLAEVLMASTYPLEVVQAERWLRDHKHLEAEQLKLAAGKQSWDDSVKSLVATSSVLDMMSTKLDWTQKLGDAVLAQQSDVMDAIQRLRQKAYANKKLISTKEQTVTVQQEQDQQTIVIEPAVPDVISVPYYDPTVVFGAWPHSEFPPYYFPPPTYLAAGVLATGIAFGAGYALERWTTGGNYWGGGMSWRGGAIGINRPINVANAHVAHWQHNPRHRQGVRYNNASVQQRFGDNNIRGGSQQRLRVRGQGPGLGDRGLASRANVAHHGRGARTGSARANHQAHLPNAANRGRDQRVNAAGRPGAGANRGAWQSASGNIRSGRRAGVQPLHGRGGVGRPSMSGGRFAARGGGGARMAGFRGGRAGGFGGGRGGMRGGGFARGGGRRSDVRLKHDLVLLGHLDSGIGFYRFIYNGGKEAYVGVLAQEVQAVMPEAVTRDRNGYLRVFYNKLGVKFQTYDRWIASGARPTTRTSIQYGPPANAQHRTSVTRNVTTVGL